MSADELNLNFNLNSRDMEASLDRVNVKLEKTDKEVLAVTNRFKEMANGGTQVTDTIKKQTAAFQTRATAIKRVYDAQGQLISQLKEVKTVTDTSARARAAQFAKTQEHLRLELLGYSKLQNVKAKIAGEQAYFNSQKQAAVVTQKTTAALKSQEKAVKGVSLSYKGLTQVIALQLLRRVIASIISGLRESVTEAVELSKRIAEIQTIAQDRPLGFEGWSQGIRDVSDEFGFGLLDTAEATYQTLSNQVAKGTEAFKFQAEAAKFARVTNSSLTDSVNLLSSALNSYDLGASHAAKTSAQLFKTIELGRIRSSEIANSLGRVTVVAGQLGINLNEVNALMAITSVRGLKARETLTQIRGTMNALLKPSEAMSGFLASIGVESGQAAIAAFGLEGVFRKMADATGGQAAAVAELVPRIRGLTATLTAIKNGGGDYAETLAKMEDSTASYTKSVALTTENAGVKVEKAANIIKNAFIDDIGGAIVESLADGVGNLDDFKIAVKSMTQTILTLASAVNKTVEFLNKFNIIKNIIAGIWDYGHEQKRAIAAIERQFKEFEEERLRAIDEETAKVEAAQKKQTQARLGAIADQVAALNKELNSAGTTLDEVGSNFKTSFGLVEKAISASVTAIGKSISDAESTVTKLKSSTKSLVSDLKGDIFSEGLSRQGADQQVNTLAAEIRKTNQLRKQAVLAGNSELAVELLKRERELAKQLIKVDGERLTERAEIDKKLIELEEKFKKSQRKKQSRADREQAIKDYKAEVADLLKARADVDDKSAGNYAKKYREIYTELIKQAEEQQAALLKIEEKRIQILKDKEKAAALEVALYKAQIKDITSFDLDKATKDKTKAEIQEIARLRQQSLTDLAVKTGKLAESEDRKAALALLNELKKAEQVKFGILLRQAALKEQARAVTLQEEEKKAVIDTNAERKKTDSILVNNHNKQKAITNEIQRQIDAEFRLGQAIKSTANRVSRREGPDIDPITGGNFASGGIAHGRDSVAARLTPGEFVMNSGSTRKFYSQLVGMNSRSNNIQNLNKGGAVSVGDVNINMTSSGNEAYDAQKLGNMLRRQIRRGTLSL